MQGVVLGSFQDENFVELTMFAEAKLARFR